jgi:nucleoid DNA-binding protein
MAVKTNTKTKAKPASKGEVLATLTEKTGLKRKQVSEVLNQLAAMAASNLSGGPGVFAIPGLVKFKVVHKPATPGGMRPNPFKPGEMMEVKPKPERKVVKAVPLKGLKEMV